MFGGAPRVSSPCSLLSGSFWFVKLPPCSGSAASPGVGVQADVGPGATAARRGVVSAGPRSEDGDMVGGAEESLVTNLKNGRDGCLPSTQHTLDFFVVEAKQVSE
jgi:hypothetical protein